MKTEDARCELTTPPEGHELMLLEYPIPPISELDDRVINAAVIGYARARRQGLLPDLCVAHAIAHALTPLDSQAGRSIKMVASAARIAEAMRDLLSDRTPESEARAREALDRWDIPF